MHIRCHLHWSPILSLAILSAITLVSFAKVGEQGQAGYVILKDGTILHGQINREGKETVDNGHELWIPKLGGFFFVEDGARRIVFSHHAVKEVRPEKHDRPPVDEEIRIPRVLKTFTDKSPGLPTAYVEQASPWDMDGYRKVTVSQSGTGSQTKQLTQAITRLTPHWTQAETESYIFRFRILTSELDPVTTVEMLRRERVKRAKKDAEDAAKAQQKNAAKQEENKKDESKKDGEKKESNPKGPKPAPMPPPEPVETFKLGLFRFCVHAGWFEQAEAERTRLLRDFPDKKSQIEEATKELRQLQAKQQQEDIELAFRAGQHVLAQQLLSEFKEEHADGAMLVKIDARKTQYQELKTQCADVARLLANVEKAAKATQLLAGFQEALAEIHRDLNFDTCARLEPFRSLALQEERLQAQAAKKPANGRCGATAGQPPAEKQDGSLTPEQLLALAVSGWVLGKEGADSNTAAALQLWQTRQAILQYLRETDPRLRGHILDKSLKNVRVDMIKQLIDLLPPPLPGQNKEKSFGLEAPGIKYSDSVKYRVQLPPEYHPQRAYPVLVVLPNIHDDLMEVLNRWGSLAGTHGYLLVLPQWAGLGQQEYGYTDRERETVLAVLNDLRLRVNVDADRVMLFGYDQAGTMAYDVGLSHPDVFAGVAVKPAWPGEVAAKYYRAHSQYLPSYVVEGERRSNSSRDRIRSLFTYWVQRGFECLLVEYISRSVEFYSGEMPYIVDWMDKKKRPQKLPQLGEPDGKELRTARESDNRFYWLSSDEIVTGPSTNPAKLTARVAADNSIVGNVAGIKQLTVWLNSTLVDFNQPVDIRITQVNATRGGRKKVEPSASVLLEDFYNRGDKKNLYVAKVDLSWK